MLLMKHRIQVLSSSLACSSLSASLPNSDCKEKQNYIVSKRRRKEEEKEEKPGKMLALRVEVSGLLEGKEVQWVV